MQQLYFLIFFLICKKRKARVWHLIILYQQRKITEKLHLLLTNESQTLLLKFTKNYLHKIIFSYTNTTNTY